MAFLTNPELRRNLENREDLWRLLREVAKCRAFDLFRRSSAQKRAAQQEQVPYYDDQPGKRVGNHPLAEKDKRGRLRKRENRRPHAVSSADDSQFDPADLSKNLLSAEATPEQCAAMLEAVEKVMEELQTKKYVVDTFKLLLQGYTDEQFAKELNVDKKTASNGVKRIQRCFQRLLSQDPDVFI